MSRHRVKSVAYDDDDLDDDYDDEELDPEEQEQLEALTDEVLEQLRSGQPGVSASRQEVQEALWHYYNDVDKAVNYLRGKKAKEAKKTAAPTAAKAAKGKAKVLPAWPAYPIENYCSPSQSSPAHFSAREFFRDSPWLNVPAHRKAEILIEPLYPRLGLMGGAPPQQEGKVSKLAALAAARKKKEAEKTAASGQAQDGASPEAGKPAMSLMERLSTTNDKKPAPARVALASRLASRPPQPRGEQRLPSTREQPAAAPAEKKPDSVEQKNGGLQLQAATLRAPPSTFAATIVGSAAPAAEPSHLFGTSVDVLHVYGEDLTEPFDFTGPSPDDVVLNAQSAAKGLKSSSKPAAATTPKGSSLADQKTEEVTSGVKSLSVEEPVKVKRQDIDVLAEYEKSKEKKSASFVVIGHVDAGKSTLMGRLLVDLNAVDSRTIDKYRREAERIGKGSFALAWVLDQGSEERARGVTIDVALNRFETEKTRFTILDAPGHRDFVPNMIAGASQADFAVLVIDASTGNFESGLRGQTKEHALLVRSMGVHRVVVCVNKMDTVGWSKDRYDEIEQQISAFLTTAGFQARNLAFVPCSGFRGDNITRRSEDPQASWYTGPVLIELLDASEPASHALDKPLRMTVGDVFRGGVQNPVSISGRIDAGNLQVGDSIVVMPSGNTALIKGIERDGDESAAWAVAGQNVVLHLANIDPAQLRSGDVVCSPTAPVRNIQSFSAKVLAFDHLTPMPVDLHRGRLHVPGRIRRLVASLDKGSGAVQKKRPKIVGPGTVARVEVEVDQAVPLEAPARIILRAGGETVAAGLLEDL